MFIYNLKITVYVSIFKFIIYCCCSKGLVGDACTSRIVDCVLLLHMILGSHISMFYFKAFKALISIFETNANADVTY